MLALAVVGVLGPSLMNLIVVLGLVGWVSFSRVVRGETLAIRAREFIVQKGFRFLNLRHS